MGMHGSHWATKKGVPPPNHLLETTVGAWVQVYEPYWNEVTWWGQVVAIVPAGVTPDPVEMATHFEVNLRAPGSSRQGVPPKVKSKYIRVVVMKPNSRRCQVFTLGGTTHYVYPRKCGYCQAEGFAPSKKDRRQCEFCDGTEGGQS